MKSISPTILLSGENKAFFCISDSGFMIVFEDLHYKKFGSSISHHSFPISEQLVYKRKQLWAEPFCVPLLCQLT